MFKLSVKMGGQSAHADITLSSDAVIMSTRHVLSLASEQQRVEMQVLPEGRSAVENFVLQDLHTE